MARRRGDAGQPGCRPPLHEGFRARGAIDPARGAGVAWTLDFSSIRHRLRHAQRGRDGVARGLAELKRFDDLTVGRELRMTQVKPEFDDLCAHLGQPAMDPDGLVGAYTA